MSRATTITAFCAIAVATASAQELTWRFDNEGDLEGWAPANFASVQVRGGALCGLTKYDCQLVSPPLNLSARDWPILEFRARSSISGGGEVFFQLAGGRFTDELKVRHFIPASSEFHIFRCDLSQHPQWQGTIERVRLDLLNPEGVEIALDHIRFLRRDPGPVPNASFEYDFDGDAMPDDWAVVAPLALWFRDHIRDGDRSLLLGTSPDAQVASASVRVPLDKPGMFSLEVAVPHCEQCPAHSITATLRFGDVLGNRLPEEPVVITAGAVAARQAALQVEFVAPRLAAWADLTLAVHGDGARAWFDEVRLVHVRELPDPCERPLNTWRGYWIWAPQVSGEDNVTCYLRRSFELPARRSQLTEARCQLTADDTYELFVNGQSVARADDKDGWRTPEVVDLLPYLVPGRNVIAIRAQDLTAAEGVLFEAEITGPRHELTLLSDDSWRAMGPSAPGDWAQPGFDDSAWPPAAVIAPAGAAPWGHLPYQFMGRPDTVKLLSAKVPMEVEAGATITVSAALDRLPASASEYPVRVALLRDDQEVVHECFDVAAVRGASTAGVALGPMRLRTARFLPPGEYQVAVGFPRSAYEGHQGVRIGSVRVIPPAAREYPPVVEVRQHNGLPTLFINNRADPFTHYIELHNSRVRIGNMRDAGVHIYQMDAGDIGWKGPDQFDYSQWDAQVLELLTYDPNAWIIPTFTFDGRHQRWWVDAHPDELCVNSEGSTRVGIYHSEGTITSLASQLWRRESGEAMRAFIAHCNAAPYATRIIGYQPCQGVSWEWQHWGSVGDYPPTDYSEPMRREFEQWTRRQYGEDLDAVRAAWRMPDLTWETIVVPPVEVRDGADHMLFRVPAANRYVIDFYRFYQDVMVDGIEHYFRIVKQATDSRALCGTYYGYTVTMLSGARRAGDSGHYALHRLLQSDLCDFLVSPFDYSERAVGEPYVVMSPIGSVLAHGKLWVMQADLRTHLTEGIEQRRHGTPDSLTGTVSQLQRAFANATAKGAATQWYDFSLGWISRDPRQAQILGRLRDIADRWITWDRTPDPEGIAVVVDEHTPACYLGHHIEAMYWLVYRQKEVFERVGAPWNIYLLDDVVAGLVPKFRCYFFLNCFHMTDAERQYINDELKSDGRTLVWLYAPGYIGADDLDAARIAELTGMNMTEVPQMRPWRISLIPDHWLTRAIGPGEIAQPNIDIGPAFVPAGADWEVAGLWAGTDWPGLTIRRFDNWTSIYSATPLLSPLLIKRIAQNAGVPVRTAGTDPSFISRSFIGLHSAVSRTETLHFEQPTRVIDLMTGEILAAAATELQVPIPGPGTRLLYTIPAQ